MTEFVLCDCCGVNPAQSTLSSALVEGVALNLCTACIIAGGEPGALVRSLPAEPVTSAHVWEAGRYIPAALYWKGHRP